MHHPKEEGNFETHDMGDGLGESGGIIEEAKREAIGPKERNLIHVESDFAFDANIASCTDQEPNGGLSLDQGSNFTRHTLMWRILGICSINLCVKVAEIRTRINQQLQNTYNIYCDQSRKLHQLPPR